MYYTDCGRQWRGRKKEGRWKMERVRRGAGGRGGGVKKVNKQGGQKGAKTRPQREMKLQSSARVSVYCRNGNRSAAEICL